MIVTEKFHDKRLKENNINIITKYLDDGTFKFRSTDLKYDDDVINGVRLNKKYIKDDMMIHEEKEFNPRILYSYIVKEEMDKDYKCHNCGATFNLKDTSICPYCRSYYNLDYSDKLLSARYHYDRIIRSNKYIFITALLDFILCFTFSFLYFRKTGRTFTSFDILKSIGYGFFFSLILFYVFYTVDALIISLPVKMIKDKENKKKEQVWNKLEELGVNKKELFNNLNCELERYFYLDNNYIDYDILDYDKYEYNIDSKNRLNVIITIYIRTISFVNNKLVSNTKDYTFTLRKNEIEQDTLNKGVNLVKCHSCGASIDVTKNECSYCKSSVNYLQSWYIVK